MRALCAYCSAATLSPPSRCPGEHVTMSTTLAPSAMESDSSAVSIEFVKGGAEGTRAVSADRQSPKLNSPPMACVRPSLAVHEIRVQGSGLRMRLTRRVLW